MPNPDVYADFVEFTVSIVPGSLIGTSLSRCCLISAFDANDAFTGRRKVYTGTPNQIRQALIDDGLGPSTAPYKMVDAFVRNVKPIGEVVVGRRDDGDADLAATLAAIIASDQGAGDDFFGFCVDTRLKAEQKFAFQWAEQRGNKFFVTYTRDPQALVGDAASLPTLLENLQIRQGMLVWYDPQAATKYGPAVLVSSAGTFDVPNGGTLTLRASGGAEQAFSFPSVAATIVSDTDGPYALAVGNKIKLRLNRGPILLIELTADVEDEYFPSGADAATAAQLAAWLNDAVPGLAASADGLKLRLSSERRGTGAHIEVYADDVADIAGHVGLPFSEFQITTGTIVPTNGDTVGVKVDALADLTVVSTASAPATAILLANAYNASAPHFAVAAAQAVGSTIVLTFRDHSAHTVTAVSPATADVTPIVLTNAAVDEETDGTGFAADASAATSTEVAARLQATILSASSAASGARFKISSTALGEELASLEVTGGSLVDEFGLELGLVTGIGTQENYLDCQLLGRIAGFDLDAPGGSVGFDNQALPQTPGNILTNTQRKAIWNHYANTYEQVTSDRPGELHPGVCPAKFDADVPWSAFWFRVRGTERVKQRQNVAADRGERIPYAEEGIATYDQVLRGLYLDGARNGHILGPDLLPIDPLGVRKTYFKTPTMGEQTPSNRAKGIFAGFDSLQESRGSAKAVKIALTIQTP